MSLTLSKKVLHFQNAQSVETYALPKHADYSVQVLEHLEPIATLWDSLAPQHNIFLQSPYLLALEQNPPAKLGFRYVILYKNEQPIGIVYTQTFHIKAEDSIQKKEDETAPKACIVRAIAQSIKNWFIRRAEFHLLICGNILLTGEFGFYLPTIQDKELSSNLVQQSVEVVYQLLQQQQQPVSLFLIKDYEVGKHPQVEANLAQNSYTAFTIQPSMYLPLRPEWKTFDNYLDSMHSKYRVRARRAAKKGLEITKQEFTLEQIEQYKSEMYVLYQNVASNAGFNAFTLHENYFYALKQHLGDQFHLVGYFIDGKLVAFYTGVRSGNDLEAHFLGVDDSYNHSHQVYLNILYDLVRMGIYYQAHSIDFARTALEIKSSVGAMPRDMYCFIRHRNSLSSAFLKILLNYLNPVEVWQQRHPFKDSPEEAEEGATA